MVEYHWLQGQFDRLPAVMADLVRRRVDVIATPAFRAGAQAAKAATSTIPIVFGVGDDPVKSRPPSPALGATRPTPSMSRVRAFSSAGACNLQRSRRAMGFPRSIPLVNFPRSAG